IAAYLNGIAIEADRRGFRFDKSKILAPPLADPMDETEGQLLYEWQHLQAKLQIRSPEHLVICEKILRPEPHSLFRIVAGETQPWEKISGGQNAKTPRR